MKPGLIVVAAFAVAAPAFAQTAPTTAIPPASIALAPSADPDQDGPAGGVKALRASCRDEAEAKGLKGPDRRFAISACVVRQRPDLAGREQCRMQGFGKGLQKEERHAFVKGCMKAKG